MSEKQICNTERNTRIKNILEKITELTTWKFIDICKNVNISVSAKDIESNISIHAGYIADEADEELCKKLVLFILGFLKDYEKLEDLILNNLKNRWVEKIPHDCCDTCEQYADILHEYQEIIEEIRLFFKDYPIVPSFLETDNSPVLLLQKISWKNE